MFVFCILEYNEIGFVYMQAISGLTILLWKNT